MDGKSNRPVGTTVVTNGSNAMSNVKTVKEIVSSIATDLGYRGQGRNSNWYRDLPDLTHVIGLQKSRWGGENYLETGIWLKVFGPQERPKYYECHVRLRLDADCGLDLGEIDLALNEDHFWKMDPGERFRVLSGALKRAEHDFFGRAKTSSDLKELLTTGRNWNLAIDKRVKELFRVS